MVSLALEVEKNVRTRTGGDQDRTQPWNFTRHGNRGPIRPRLWGLIMPGDFGQGSIQRSLAAALKIVLAPECVQYAAEVNIIQLLDGGG